MTDSSNAANPFDQFDSAQPVAASQQTDAAQALAAPAQPSGNPFDQFDGTPAPAAKVDPVAAGAAHAAAILDDAHQQAATVSDANRARLLQSLRDFGSMVKQVPGANLMGDMAGSFASTPAPPAPAPVPGDAWDRAAAQEQANFNAAPSMGHDLGRAALMTSRDLAHGAMALPGLVQDGLVMTPYNAIAKAIGSDSRINPASQQLDAFYNSVGVPDPQPQNGTERVVSGIDRGIGGLLGGVGAGKALLNSANPTAQAIGDLLTSRLGAQTAATATGVGGSELAREAGVGPTGQVIAGIGGGLSPVGLAAGREGLLNASARLLSKPSPQAAELAQTALDHGIPLSASQVSPSKTAKLIDSITGQVPFSGSQTFADNQRAAFMRAVSKTIGQNSPVVDSNVYAAAKKAIGDSYDDLASRVNPKITPELQDGLAAAMATAKEGADPVVIGAAQNALDRIKNAAVDGVIPGSAYKKIDSAFGNMAKNGGEKGQVIGAIQQALRDAFTASAGPADQAQMALANKQYGNLMTIKPLVAGDAVEGQFSPASLLARVNANAAGKASMAEGRRGDLGDLANIGQRFIKSKIPDSGTAQRLATMDMAKKLGTAAVGAAAGTAVGLPTALLSAAGIVQGSRAYQRAMQNPELVNLLLGNKSPSEVKGLMGIYTDPAIQGATQGHQ